MKKVFVLLHEELQVSCDITSLCNFHTVLVIICILIFWLFSPDYKAKN
jgi:hypothetical protein